MADPARSFAVVRVRGTARAVDVDRAATEEPLEIRLQGRPFAVVMRTPGADRELAAGFLLSEQVIRTAADLGTIEYCAGRSNDGLCGADGENIVNVTLTGRSRDAIERM